MREADHLRADLIRARDLLAECMGWMNALEIIAPNAAAVTRQHIQDKVRAFQQRPIAVLPEGVVP